jgi:DNA-binding NarL/FixJ family response regulator
VNGDQSVGIRRLEHTREALREYGMRVDIIAGARLNFAKIAPILRARVLAPEGTIVIVNANPERPDFISTKGTARLSPCRECDAGRRSSRLGEQSLEERSRTLEVSCDTAKLREQQLVLVEEATEHVSPRRRDGARTPSWQTSSPSSPARGGLPVCTPNTDHARRPTTFAHLNPGEHMHSGETILVAILDDNRLLRDGLSTMLNELPDMRVVASMAAHSSSLAETPAHVLLLDVGLLDEESLRVAIALRAEMPDTKIIVMDLVPVHEEIMDFVNAGVSGFVLKDATLDEFVATIRSVASGQKVLPPRMTGSVFSQIVSDAGEHRRNGKEHVLEDVRMTRREREVIELIGEGLSNKEIAQRLNIASHTVKSHVRNVVEKLALHTRLQIAAYSRR